MSDSNENAYAVMWLTRGADDGLFTHTYVYKRLTGIEVRTYFQGHLDPLAGEEARIPRFERAHEAMEWMIEHLGEKALIESEAASSIRQDRYAKPV